MAFNPSVCPGKGEQGPGRRAQNTAQACYPYSAQPISSPQNKKQNKTKHVTLRTCNLCGEYSLREKLPLQSGEQFDHEGYVLVRNKNSLGMQEVLFSYRLPPTQIRPPTVI
jgi:hypothetical protein